MRGLVEVSAKGWTYAFLTATYAFGTMASFWFVERVAAF
ncbi:hypothetical protein J2X72_004719 [Phyllobacterium sp. 1468]|nr:hypothetical protein [Phyllobacterium sp. 1468]